MNKTCRAHKSTYGSLTKTSNHTGCKYHTDQSQRILLTNYFFTSGTGRHFDLSPLAVQWVTTRLLWKEKSSKVRDGVNRITQPDATRCIVRENFELVTWYVCVWYLFAFPPFIKWTEWMAEILFSSDLCVCVSVCSGPVNQTSLCVKY